MNRIYCFICAAALLLTACTAPKQELVGGENEGVLCLNIELLGTRAELDPTKAFELKIYRYAAENSKELIRKYTSLSDIPQYIWLINDNYCATVKVGDKQLASFEEQYYTGSADFTITAGQTTSVEVDCQMVNIPVAVNFDATVAAHFTKSFYSYVSIADSFDLEAAENGKVPTLKYTDTATGYFILPEGSKNLSWYFYGNDGEQTITQQGVIENVEPQKLYSLKFKYSKDAPGYITIEATIDTTPDYREDKIPFSPDPTVKGIGFDASATHNYTGDSYSYTVSALDNITHMVVSYGENKYNLLNSTYEEFTVTKISAKEYTVVITPAMFATMYGGVQTITFNIEDASGGKGTQKCNFNIKGIISLEENYDLWYNTADFSALSFSSNATVGYRAEGQEWKHINITASGVSNIYNATATDFSAGKRYEYALFEDGVQVGKSLFVNTPAGAQIPEAGFEVWSTASDEAMCPAADPNNLFWDTGNHATAGLVGEQLTVSSTDVRAGSNSTHSAYMHSIKAAVAGIGKFAAGNLFVGRFVTVAGMGGVVEFGRAFEFTARPKAIRFWIKNNQGTINEGSYTTGTDMLKIFCCLATRKYTVNTNYESSFFNPSFETEGIIAYAYWDSKESRSEWTQIELPIDYKPGETTKPTTLVLTFTCSGYGDYFTGSTNSYMYVDDVEFVY